jgi:hypothetical protein
VLTDAAAVRVGTRLHTVLRHGSLESTVDRADAGTPAENEQMYDAIPGLGDQ